MQNEQIVVTCFSGLYNYYGAGSVIPNPNGFVVAQFDTTSGTIAPLLPLTTAPPKLWTGPASAGYHNELNPGNEWRASRLGEVFGVALDDLSPPNIYVGASNCYNQVGVVTSLNATAPQGPGGIYRLDATSGVVSGSTNLPSVAGTLPGTGPGIGNLCFRRAGNNTGFLYASNLDDGKIYRLNAASMAVVGAPFDHGVQGRPQESLSVINDNGAAGLTPVGRRIWGVQTYQNRLFYAVWWEDSRNILAAESNEVWSVDLDNNGDFIPSTARRRLTVPNYPQPGAGLWSHPIASIDFSPGGAMYLAERYWQLQPLGSFDLTFGAHFARLHRFTLSGPNWVTTPAITHEIGTNPGPTPAPATITGASCAGGVAVNCDDSVWATGDMFNGYTPTDSTTNSPIFGPYRYGAIRIPPGGNVTPSAALRTRQFHRRLRRCLWKHFQARHRSDHHPPEMLHGPHGGQYRLPRQSRRAVHRGCHHHQPDGGADHRSPVRPLPQQSITARCHHADAVSRHAHPRQSHPARRQRRRFAFAARSPAGRG